MNRRRHPAGPVTIQQVGSNEPPVTVSPNAFRQHRTARPTPTEETPRLFARRAHAVRDGSGQSDDEDRGYTPVVALARCDEPEAVPDGWQTARSDRARAEAIDAANVEAAAVLANMHDELDRLRSLVPGDRRSYFREIAHGLKKISMTLTK